MRLARNWEGPGKPGCVRVGALGACGFVGEMLDELKSRGPEIL